MTALAVVAFREREWQRQFNRKKTKTLQTQKTQL